MIQINKKLKYSTFDINIEYILPMYSLEDKFNLIHPYYVLTKEQNKDVL